jgi:nucleoside-diphosphate-sugar epimerase
MRKKAILITGACGEIGHALIEHLIANQMMPLVTLDLADIPPAQQEKLALSAANVVAHVKGSITDQSLLDQLASEYEFEKIFHLAALLSTRAELAPAAAHQVNVEGTLMLLELAAGQSQSRGAPVQFIFPSSIAAYGMPDLATKAKHPKVKEWEWNYPTTMYGANKLYCERLGIYYSGYYKQLAEQPPVMLDFRSVRFPGLISAFTIPSGGTSDYGPEMLHAAAQGQPYECFVREDTTINFMAMPDAIRALLDLAKAPAEKLNQRVYNVSSFSLSAEAFCQQVSRAFPAAQITYQPHPKRQGIVDTWPMDTDDTRARRDWGWQPEYDLARSFEEYLVPNIRKRYQS